MQKTKKHFTLVELLAVIAIIGILAGILIPALGGAQLRGKITQAKSDMKTIETALEAFASDNGGRYVVDSSYRWGGKAPNATRTTDNTKRTVKYSANAKYVLLELCDPENATCNNNKRKIRYMDPSKNYQNTSDDLWLDPWGNSYNILLCIDGRGKVFPHTTSGANAGNTSDDRCHIVHNSIALWSYGPDGSDNFGTNTESDNCGSNTTADDVASWHK